MGNPTQIQKYGDLHFGKINKKLSKCKPGLDLLLASGFKKSTDNKRLIWTEVNNNNNIILLNRLQNELRSMVADNEANESKQEEHIPVQQKQQVCH